jgi:hypothetical protein
MKEFRVNCRGNLKRGTDWAKEFDIYGICGSEVTVEIEASMSMNISGTVSTNHELLLFNKNYNR